MLTSHDASAAVGISDGTVGVDAELSLFKITVDTVLSIVKLANGAGSTTGGLQMKAAAVASAHKGVGTGSESCNGNKVSHFQRTNVESD